MTSGGDLKAKFCIHAVGPVYGFKRNEWDEKNAQLRSTYRSALGCAREANLETVAFALISSSIWRGAQKLEKVLSEACIACSEATYPGLRELHLVAFTPQELDALIFAATSVAAEMTAALGPSTAAAHEGDCSAPQSWKLSEPEVPMKSGAEQAEKPVPCSVFRSLRIVAFGRRQAFQPASARSTLQTMSSRKYSRSQRWTLKSYPIGSKMRPKRSMDSFEKSPAISVCFSERCGSAEPQCSDRQTTDQPT